MQVNQQAETELAKQVIEKLCSEYTKQNKGPDKAYLGQIKCLSCGRYDAFTNVKQPWRIKCNHDNTCGASLKYTDYFPTLVKEVYSKFKLPDPVDRARRYASIERGIKNYEKWGCVPVRKNLRDENVYALEFQLHSESKKFCAKYRMIDHSKEKHCLWGDKRPAMWIPKTGVDFTKAITIAEDPIKAMGLLEAQIQAISVLSSNCLPKEKSWMKENLKKIICVILAFDNDPAGWAATKRWVDFLEGEGVDYEIAFPIEGKDWDDMRKEGLLNAESFEDCKLAGRLFQAEDAQDAAEKIHEHHDKCPKIFEWKGATYRVKYSKNDPETIEYVTQVLGGTLRGNHVFYGFDDDDERVSKTFLNYKSSNFQLGSQKFSVTGEDLSSERKFDAKMVTRLSRNFKGTRSDLHFIMENFVKLEDLKRIRQYPRYGYDPKSKAYVFANFAVTETGKILKLNKERYFDNIDIAPLNNKTSEGESLHLAHETQCDLRQIIELLHQAWGMQALTALGYYVCTLFSEVTFKRYLFHPHLSLYGFRNRGKSKLTHMLNRMFIFEDVEGTPLTAKSTAKGIARAMSRPRSLPVVFIEGNQEERLPINENDLLSIYNRQCLLLRANKTNDNTTNGLPYHAGLVLVQNHEWFTQPAVKERFVSIFFEDRGGVFTAKERVAFNSLMTMPVSQFVGAGLQILANRKHFEDRILGHIERVSQCLKDREGLNNDRVRDNHALVLGGLTCLLELAYGTEIPYLDESFKSVTTIAKRKLETAVFTSDNVSHFFNAFEELMRREQNSGLATLQEGRHYIKDEKNIYIRLTETTKTMQASGYQVVDARSLALELRQSQHFVEETKVMSKKWFGGRRFSVFVLNNHCINHPASSHIKLVD